MIINYYKNLNKSGRSTGISFGLRLHGPPVKVSVADPDPTLYVGMDPDTNFT